MPPNEDLEQERAKWGVFEKEFIDRLYSERRLIQQRREVEALHLILCGLCPRVVLEIGVYRGGSMSLWARAADQDALLIGIDNMEGVPWMPIEEKEKYYRDWISCDREDQVVVKRIRTQVLKLVIGNSGDVETLEQVKAILAGRNVDFLFIDGCHEEAAVRRDFELYSPLVGTPGIIAFHDVRTSQYHEKAHCRAGQVWDEVRIGRDHLTLLGDKQWGGIGVLFT